MSTTRLPAEERRAALLETACRLFSEGSYRGTTTADIAREAGVTEPVLYRHFDSKRDLYLACLEATWAGVRAMWEEAIAAESDPSLWVATMGIRRACRDSAKARSSPVGSVSPTVANAWYSSATNSRSRHGPCGLAAILGMRCRTAR